MGRSAKDALGESVATSNGAPTPKLPVTVGSFDGRNITVDDISRIVPLEGDLAEALFDLGLGDKVVGRDITATFAEAAELPVVTRAHEVSAESVLSLRPTLVLADEDSGPPEAIEHIRNVGVPIVVFKKVTKISEIDDRIGEVAAALGIPAAGTTLIEDTDKRLHDVLADAPESGRPRVAFLYLRGGSGIYLMGGPGSGTDSIIEAVGGIDAGKAIKLDRAFTPLTSEALVDASPDAFLVTTTGLESVGGIDGLLEVPGVAQTPAGKARRVIAVEDGVLFSFGPRTPEVLQGIIGKLYAP